MSEFNLNSYLKQLEASKNINDCEKVPVPEIEKDQNYIFISYSHQDYKSVYFDLAHLYDKGVRFWYDKGLPAGEDWERVVKEHIQNPYCSGVIFYISTNTFLSDSIFKEIEFTTEKKRNKRTPQKNYFCVNLQNDKMLDIILNAREIQQNSGAMPLDEEQLTFLMSTFSEKHLYLKFNDSHHVDELVEKIKQKFDVTKDLKDVPTSVFSLSSIKEARVAFLVLFEKETDPIPLFKYLYSEYKRTKHARPWHLLVVGIVISLIVSLLAIYFLCTTQAIPAIANLRFEFQILSVVYACLMTPWEAAKIFWFFYISPVSHKREHGVIFKAIHFLFFLIALSIITLFLTAVIIGCVFLFNLFVERYVK